jgi:nucleotide-binding universal stress UspA family protein
MYRNILIPVLLDDPDTAKKSFRAAQTLADEGARFTVLHVRDAIPSFAASEIPEDVMKRSQDELRRALADSARGLPGAQTRLVTGHAGRAILDVAEDEGSDCIVVASHRPGLEDFFLGSTAARVVRHAQCSVHVIR